MKTKKQEKKNIPFKNPCSSIDEYHCRNCGYVPKENFFRTNIEHKSHKCKKCQMKASKDSRRKKDSMYKKMLIQLKKKCKNHKQIKTSLLDENDMIYLYEQAWRKTCAITNQTQDKKKLRFTLWKHNEGLDPWNLVLVLKKYAALCGDDNVKLVYSDHVTQNIENTLKNIKSHYLMGMVD